MKMEEQLVRSETGVWRVGLIPGRGFGEWEPTCPELGRPAGTGSWRRQLVRRKD